MRPAGRTLSQLIARDSERALGVMLEAGREVGDVRAQGQGNIEGVDLSTLSIQKDLAADCTSFAKVPDEVWSEWVEQAREQGKATHSAFSSTAREYLRSMKEADENEQAVQREIDRVTR